MKHSRASRISGKPNGLSKPDAVIILLRTNRIPADALQGRQPIAMKRKPNQSRRNAIERSSGVLMHVTSLPGPYGIGDLGPAALRFVDDLAKAKQTWWQILPLGPPAAGDSPYQCYS